MITGLVLAGGQGARMGGQDKGLLPYHGRPLAAHALDRLRPQVDQLMISANRHLDTYVALGVPVWPDTPPDGPFAADEPAYAGPLAGIHSGLLHSETEFLACVPCDSPDFPVDLVARLAAGLAAADDGASAAVASIPGADGPRRQPVFCLLRRSLQPRLQAYLAAGGRKVDGFLRDQGAAEVLFDDGAAFANVNTLADLARLAALPTAPPAAPC